MDPKLPVVHTGTVGRPPYSDKVRQEILKALKMGCTRTAAFGSVGIHESTMHRWMQDIEGFREAVQEAESYAERLYTKRLAQRAVAGDTKAITFWLERRRNGQWRERTAVVDEEASLEDVMAVAEEDDALRSRLADLAAEAERRRASAASDGGDRSGPPEDGGSDEPGVAD